MNLLHLPDRGRSDLCSSTLSSIKFTFHCIGHGLKPVTMATEDSHEAISGGMAIFCSKRMTRDHIGWFGEMRNSTLLLVFLGCFYCLKKDGDRQPDSCLISS